MKVLLVIIKYSSKVEFLLPCRSLQRALETGDEFIWQTDFFEYANRCANKLDSIKKLFFLYNYPALLHVAGNSNLF